MKQKAQKLHERRVVNNKRKSARKKFRSAAAKLHSVEIYFEIVHNGTNRSIDFDIQRNKRILSIDLDVGTLGGKINPVMDVGRIYVIDGLF